MKAPIARAAMELATPYEPPAPGLEAGLARAFAQALEIDEVGRNDGFFDLGGDSLRAVQLAQAVTRELGMTFAVSLLAEAGTPRELARVLSASASAQPSSSSGPAAPPPIFSVHGQQGYMLPRKEFMDGLRSGQRFHMFELPGLLAGPRLKRVEEIAAAYCAQLSAMHPNGPVYLTGFCAGALISIEMALQLARAGRPVARLVLVEPNIPHQLVEIFDAGRWDDPASDARYSGEPRRRAAEAHKHAKLVQASANGRDNFARRHPEHRFSMDARAKLLAAYMVYKPGLLDQTVELVISQERVAALQLPVWDRIIPRRTLNIAGASHAEVLAAADGATAALIQRLFDETPAGTA